MLITPDDQESKGLSDPKVETKGLHDEPPPSYSPPTESVASGSAPSSPPPPTTPNVKPTNFLVLSNDQNTIRGEFVIDPSIIIPSSMLPPLDEGETEDDRKNLCLSSKYNSVHASIWLLCPPRDNTHKPRRTTIVLTSDHGSIHSQVQSLDGAAPFSLTARATHGTVRLAIPYSFQGLISLSTRHGSVTLSDALLQNATQLSQLDTTRRYFVGNFSLLGEDEWQGDQVEIEAPHGSIRVKYIYEVASARGKKGLFSRLFGM